MIRYRFRPVALRASARNPKSPSSGKRRWLWLGALCAAALLIITFSVGSASGNGATGTEAIRKPSAKDAAVPAEQPDVAPPSSLPVLDVPATTRTATVNVVDPLGLEVDTFVDVLATFDPDIAPSTHESLRIARRAVVRSVKSLDDFPGQVAVSLLVSADQVPRIEFATRYGDVSLSVAPREEDNQALEQELPTIRQPPDWNNGDR